jgi:hypothetical protein
VVRGLRGELVDGGRDHAGAGAVGDQVPGRGDVLRLRLRPVPGVLEPEPGVPQLLALGAGRAGRHGGRVRGAELVGQRLGELLGGHQPAAQLGRRLAGADGVGLDAGQVRLVRLDRAGQVAELLQGAGPQPPGRSRVGAGGEHRVRDAQRDVRLRAQRGLADAHELFLQLRRDVRPGRAAGDDRLAVGLGGHRQRELLQERRDGRGERHGLGAQARVQLAALLGQVAAALEQGPVRVLLGVAGHVQELGP